MPGDEKPTDLVPDRMAGFLGELLDVDARSPKVPEHPGLSAALADGYVAQAWLGEGGEGEVWRGVDAGNTGREVAIKIRKPSDRASEGAFADEIRALKRLNHPGVVGLIRQGGRGASRYLVFELIDGLPLEQFIRSRRPDTPELLLLMQGVCEAVAAVHAANLVHADLKPSNILVRDDATPVLIDFGLACRPGGEGKAVARRSVRGGTKPFLAPELCDGEAMPSPASDLYALAETFRRAAAATGRAAPAGLMALLDQATGADPVHRRGSAVDLAQGLARLQASASRVRARPLRLAGALGLAAAALIAAGSVVGVGGWAPARDTPRPAPSPAPVVATAVRAQTLLYKGERDLALAELKDMPPTARGWEWRHLWADATQPPVMVRQAYPEVGTASVLAPTGETALVGTSTGSVYQIGFDGGVTELNQGDALIGHLALLDAHRSVAVDHAGQVRVVDRGAAVPVARVAGRPAVCWPSADAEAVLVWDAAGLNVFRVDLTTGRKAVAGQAGLVLPAPSSPGWVWATEPEPKAEDEADPPMRRQWLMGPGWKAHRQEERALAEAPASVDHDAQRGSTVVGTFNGVLRYFGGPDEAARSWRVTDQALTAVVLSEDERRIFAVSDALYVFDLDREEVVLTLAVDIPGVLNGIRWNPETAALTVASDLAMTQWKAPSFDNLLALR